MPETVSIPARFNGPLTSGNGGYSAGVVASLLGGPAEVSLRRPVPLDTPLEVDRPDADSVRLLDGEELIAEGRAAAGFQIDVPAAVHLSEARAAKERYRGVTDGVFSRCFVCGKAREDAFGVFAGAVDDREVVASPWKPEEWTANPQGEVHPELVWAVLDCPTYPALYAWRDELPMSVLARLTARIDAPVVAGVEHVVMAWPIGFDGRKHHAGVAILDPEERPVARGQALLIQAR
jgi:hypothetical protein